MSKISAAIKAVNTNGALLVFPVNNKPTPNSIWSEFYPRTKLKWEWDDNGDQKVFKMWQLMKELSTNKDVVYSKWLGGRATFFSRDLFVAMLALFKKTGGIAFKLSLQAKALLSELESDSPLSTRDLKKLTGLQGKDNESAYNRGMKELFGRLLIVGFGEVEDGAFPSLAVGATQHIYEDLWIEASDLNIELAQKRIDQLIPKGTEFRKFFDRIMAGLQNQTSVSVRSK
ncbi:MAG: hypothetical protein B7Y39_12370 [Bdellovibrio sp. 28-41-41]|nr:MAG: hypothetical protein B7Y39_12370 [Bdellovibrio sp. 28-41-41]